MDINPCSDLYLHRMSYLHSFGLSWTPCLCVCIYIYVCIYIFVYMCLSTYTNTHTHTYTYSCTFTVSFTFTFTYTNFKYINICIYKYTYTYKCIHVCIYIHIHTHTSYIQHTYIHTYIHAYIHIYIYMHTCIYIVACIFYEGANQWPSALPGSLSSGQLGVQLPRAHMEQTYWSSRAVCWRVFNHERRASGLGLRRATKRDTVSEWPT